MNRPTDEQLRALGKTLREIDPSALQPDEEGGRVRWFLGDAATELFAWTVGDAPPHHVQLNFARVSIEWSADDGLRTGTFQNTPATAGGRYDAYLLRVSNQIDPEVCHAALTLLEVSPLPAEVRAPIEQAIANALALDTQK